MKIEEIKIGYSTSIPIAAYGIKDNAWAELRINTEGDAYDYHELWVQLKKTVDDAVRKEYPHLFEANVRSAENISPFIVPIFQPEVPTVEGIQSCKTIQELEQRFFKSIDYIKDAEEKRKLWIVYDDVYEKLCPKK